MLQVQSFFRKQQWSRETDLNNHSISCKPKTSQSCPIQILLSSSWNFLFLLEVDYTKLGPFPMLNSIKSLTWRLWGERRWKQGMYSQIYGEIFRRNHFQSKTGWREWEKNSWVKRQYRFTVITKTDSVFPCPFLYRILVYCIFLETD